jgi:hypothetical protein
MPGVRESRQREVHPGFVHRSHGERCALRSLPSTGRRQLGHPWPRTRAPCSRVRLRCSARTTGVCALKELCSTNYRSATRIIRSTLPEAVARMASNRQEIAPAFPALRPSMAIGVPARRQSTRGSACRQGRLSPVSDCVARHEPREFARRKKSVLQTPRSATAHVGSARSEAVARMATNRGPCQAAIDLRNSPKGRAHDARVPNAGTGMCRREAPKVDCALAGQEARRAPGRGGLLFGYISLGHSRESNSRAEGA